MDWKTLYFDPKGRIGPKDFWTGLATIFAIGIVFGLIFAVTLSGVPVIDTLFGLGLLVPCYCLATKRLHDIGKPDILAMIFVLANAVMVIVSLFMTPSATGLAVPIMVAFAVIIMPDFLTGMEPGNPENPMSDPTFSAAMTEISLSLAVCLATLAFVLWIGLTKGDAAANAPGAPHQTP